jgi:hypothetical protein
MAELRSKYGNHCKKKGLTNTFSSVIGKNQPKDRKPKRFNWFHKELGYMRPGSIEIPGCFQ